MKRKDIGQDVVERARAAYPKAVQSAVAYIGPLATPAQRRPADAALARMRPEDVAAIAQQDPAAAAAAAERIEVIDARAVAAPPYPDIVE